MKQELVALACEKERRKFRISSLVFVLLNGSRKKTMQRTLSEHISYLEQKIEAIRKGLQEPGRSLAEKSEMKIDLGIAERSLVHFQKAFALEKKLSDSVRGFKTEKQ
jgi:hypothetical protein